MSHLFSKFLNEQHTRKYPASGVTNYIVADSYKSNEEDEATALDHYLLDEDIVRFVKQTITFSQPEAFYEKSKSSGLVDAFFSKPYPSIASKCLGYPVQG